MINAFEDIDLEWLELFTGFIEKEMKSYRAYPRYADAPVIIERAQHYPLSVSALHRAVAELVQERVIRLSEAFPKPVDREFRARVAAMSSSDCRIAYQRDPDFKRQWDAMSLEDGDSIRQSAESVSEVAETYSLTASEWRSLPPHVAARKMQDPKFRAAVDKLILERSI